MLKLYHESIIKMMLYILCADVYYEYDLELCKTLEIWHFLISYFKMLHLNIIYNVIMNSVISLTRSILSLLLLICRYCAGFHKGEIHGKDTPGYSWPPKAYCHIQGIKASGAHWTSGSTNLDLETVKSNDKGDK